MWLRTSPFKTKKVSSVLQPLVRYYTKVKVIPPSPTAKRESPTPIACFAGLWSTSQVYETTGITKRLSSLGYTVGLIDIEWPSVSSSSSTTTVSSSSSFPSGTNDIIPLDDIIDNMRTTITKSLGHSPLAITQFHTSILLQKYLESHPLSGLIMISPFPPACGSLLQRWLQRHREEKKGQMGSNNNTMTITLNDTNKSLMDTINTSKGNNSRLSGTPIELDTVSLTNRLRTMNPTYSSTRRSSMNENGGNFQGISNNGTSDETLIVSQAQLLQRFAKEPVMLEPQPVPMMILTSVSDATMKKKILSTFITPEEIEETINYHELDNDSIVEINEEDIAASLNLQKDIQQPPSLSSSSSVSALSHDYDILCHTLGLSSAIKNNEASFLDTKAWKSIEAWIDRRY